jgi:hypothetical protein
VQVDTPPTYRVDCLLLRYRLDTGLIRRSYLAFRYWFNSSIVFSISIRSLAFNSIVIIFKFTYIIGSPSYSLCTNAIQRMLYAKLRCSSTRSKRQDANAGSPADSTRPDSISLNLHRKPHRKAETVRQSRKKDRGPLKLKRVFL